MGCCTSNQKSAGVKDVQLMDRNSRRSNGDQISPFSTRGDNAPTDSISPQIGFVIKTRRSDAEKTKIFINLFHNDNVKEMYPIELTSSWDKKGDTCLVYGVIFPRAKFMSIEKDEKRRDEVC